MTTPSDQSRDRHDNSLPFDSWGNQGERWHGSEILDQNPVPGGRDHSRHCYWIRLTQLSPSSRLVPDGSESGWPSFLWVQKSQEFLCHAFWNHELESLTGNPENQVNDNILRCQWLRGKGVRFQPLKKKRPVQPEKSGSSQMGARENERQSRSAGVETGHTR